MIKHAVVAESWRTLCGRPVRVWSVDHVLLAAYELCEVCKPLAVMRAMRDEVVYLCAEYDGGSAEPLSKTSRGQDVLAVSVPSTLE